MTTSRINEYRDLELYGAATRAWSCKDPEVLLSGPAGTGKSRMALEKVHAVLAKYKGARGLMARKTRASLSQTAIVTYREEVVHPQQWLDGSIEWNSVDQEFRYHETGSKLIVGGLDNSLKIMSAQYDIAYLQELSEIGLQEYEKVTTRMRNGMVPYQQVISDTNPDSPYHWILKRAHEPRQGLSLELYGPGPKLTMLESRHEDNPRLFKRDGTMTDYGKPYMAKLDDLTGVRLQRLRYGRWVAAEGIVYDTYDRAVNLIDPFEIPSDWRRYRSIDFGFTNPFTCQWWAVDHDGRMYLYRELYMTQRLVSDHAQYINQLSEGERITETVADHDAEDRATLYAAGIETIPANKAISPGLQTSSERMRKVGDGKPRLYIMRGALVERDLSLAESGQPICLDAEMDSYVWPEGKDGKAEKEEPMDLYNHGCDAMRYMVMHLDDQVPDAMPVTIVRPSLWRGSHEGGW